MKRKAVLKQDRALKGLEFAASVLKSNYLYILIVFYKIPNYF